MLRLFIRYKITLIYIGAIVLINTLFSVLPLIHVWGSEVSPLDFVVGIVYVLRDFVQREIQHKVIIAMLVGGVLSYIFADKTVAIASIVSFMIAETIDWAIFTFTRKPLSKRILWSASISSPFDSCIFLWMIHQLNFAGAAIMTSIKILGIFILWCVWRRRALRNATRDATALSRDNFSPQTASVELLQERKDFL